MSDNQLYLLVWVLILLGAVLTQIAALFSLYILFIPGGLLLLIAFTICVVRVWQISRDLRDMRRR